MPLIAIVRALTTFVSLLILSAGGYLLWSWQAGADVVAVDGDIVRVREDWRLWAGAALLLWSLLGRLVMTPLLAAPDRRRRPRDRENGGMLEATNGSKLYIETHGPTGAPVIIFTHGWGLDSTVWSYAKADLAERFQLIFWDLPGLGRSRPAGRDGISLERFATDLARLVTMVERPVVLVGHSIGGMTIQTLVRDHPDVAGRLAGVVLLNTTYTNPLETMVFGRLMQSLRGPLVEPALGLTIWLQPLAWLSQWQSYMSGSAHLAHRLGFGRYVTRSQLDQSALLATRNPPGAQARGNLAMFRWDATGAIANLAAPLLVICGDKDIITKAEASHEIARATGARVEIIEGVNHMGFLERADLYNQLIADFASDAHRAASRSA